MCKDHQPTISDGFVLEKDDLEPIVIGTDQQIWKRLGSNSLSSTGKINCENSKTSTLKNPKKVWIIMLGVHRIEFKSKI